MRQSRVKLEKNETDSKGPNTLENQILQRLDRLEKKVDRLGEALIEIAKTEERVIRLMESDNEKTKWLRALQDRVVDLEKKDAEEKAVSRRVERAIWAFITAAFSIAAAIIVSLFKT